VTLEQNKETFVIESNNLQQLLDALKKEGYKVIGPKISDQAIIYDEIETVSELPIGIKDVQEPGKYKLEKRSDKAFFGFTVSPQSWKKYLLPPVTKLWEATYSKDGICFKEESLPDKKQAFIGVKACELNAIKVQDKVYLEGEFVNPLYKRLRENTFIVAINCIYASKNCFCTSMNTGPKHTDGFDLALTEIIEDEKHYFVVEVGSEQGMEILKSLDSKVASKSNLVNMEQVIENTVNQIQKKLDTNNIKELLYSSYESKNWEEVATRCLACANCTMVCPTCFCTTVEDTTDLTSDHAERWQRWDSCFTMDFSYIHGGNVRSSTSSRYRQWLVHKLGTWIDQFGTSGCVGCGRCITWCPVGIDITEEVKELRKAQGK